MSVLISMTTNGRTDGGVTPCDVVKSSPQQATLHVKRYITKCRVNRHLVFKARSNAARHRAQAPIKLALQRVIFVRHVLGVLEAQQIGFRVGSGRKKLGPPNHGIDCSVTPVLVPDSLAVQQLPM